MNEQRARIFSLERELDAMKNVDHQSLPEATIKRPAPDPVTNGSRKKRKRGNTNGVEETLEGRREVGVTAYSPADAEDAPHSRMGSRIPPNITDESSLVNSATGLPSAVYALQKSLSQTPFVASTTGSIVMLIISMIRESIIAIEPLPQASNGGNDIIQPKATARPAAIVSDDWGGMCNGRLPDASTGRTIFSVVFTAIEKIWNSVDGNAIQSQLIYVTVKLLKDILDRVCHLAAATPIENRGRKEMPTRRGTDCDKRPDNPQALEWTPVEGIMRICSFFVGALQSLRRAQETDEAIREGLMFFLLGRIGGILNTFVFGEDDGLWNVALGQDDTRATELSAFRQETRISKERQAPYLIWLLERSMACFTVDTGPSSQCQTTSQAVRSPSRRVRQGILSKKLKLQLQDTILKEVLGDDLRNFKSALEQCQDPGICIEPWPAIRQTDIVDYFKAEVWRLVGWDCLKDQIEWGSR